MSRTATRSGLPTAAYTRPERATEGYGTEPGVGAGVTARESGGSTLELPAGEALELDGSRFVVEEAIGRRGGEATVYRIRDEAGRHLALKLYRAFSRVREEPNPEALARVMAIGAPGVLRLHRFGAGARKLRGRFCYEVSDLALGGDLLSVPEAGFADFYTTERVRRVVVPQLFEGLRALQHHRLYHCDLKPQNLLWLDRERTRLAIGDFGAAKLAASARPGEGDGEGAAVAHTDLVKGTDFYLAPEQARRIISSKNDYYSFGMVLIHLLRPEVVNREGLGRILRRQLDRRPPLDDEEGRLGELGQLIGGLTLYDPEARWGEAEVLRWLDGEPVEVRYRSDLPPIKVDAQRMLHTVTELCAFVERDPRAAEILVEDEVAMRDLRTWVARLEGLEAQRRFVQSIEQHRGRGDGGAAREGLLRWFDPGRPVRIAEASFDVAAASDPVAEAVRAFRHLDRTARGAPESAPAMAARALVALEWLLRRIAEGKLAARSTRARGRAQALCTRIDATLDGRRPPTSVEPAEAGWDGVPRWFLHTAPDRLLSIFHAVDPDRGFRGPHHERADTLEELGLFLAAHPDSLESPATRLEVRALLAVKEQAELASLPRRGLIFALLSRQQRVEVQLVSLAVERAGYRVVCEVGRSLAELLRASGLRGTGLEPAREREEYLVERAKLPAWRRLRRRVAAGTLASAVEEAVRARHGLLPEAFDSTTLRELSSALEKALAADERHGGGRLVLAARVALVAVPLAALGGGALALRHARDTSPPVATVAPPAPASAAPIPPTSGPAAASGSPSTKSSGARPVRRPAPARVVPPPTTRERQGSRR